MDVESDGPVPHLYSMVCFGAVVVESSGLSKKFYGKTKPISEKWDPEALAISGFSREQHEAFDDPKEVMEKFENWLKLNSKGRPVFVSDNNGFDWSFINYYFHAFLGRNPFGHSSRRLGDLYCGLKKDASVNSEWKKLYRKTTHNHDPVQDALGNAEALLSFKKELGLKIGLN